MVPLRMLVTSWLIGLFALALGGAYLRYPQAMFHFRHFLTVSPDSELSEFGVTLYRLTGAFLVLVGVFMLVGPLVTG